ncbi:glycosyltransferase family 9 protein [Jiulongibacter sp. NS-SX5]|uniref:glycosyltransferase family 9 protein n=1 Tax=Jiulongibacter sp. NS-SX5 TaxID=3463854 RepID=UPI0040586238
MKTYLIIRFSAMGDIILTLPVLVEALLQNPGVQFKVLTRPKFTVFFEGYDRIEVLPFDIDSEFKGLFGIWRLTRRLKKKYAFDAIFDLHQNLRSGLIKLFLPLIPSFTLNKGRSEKRALTRKKNKIRKELKSSTERYADVLRKAGLIVNLSTTVPFNYFKNLPSPELEKNRTWIGIAPFAQHAGKIWPIHKIEEVISKSSSDILFLLFGGGEKEVEVLSALSQKYSNTHLAAGQYSLKEELGYIAQLDQMLCMDSSNMHLAAISGVPTISVWGATHSDAGFGPYGAQDHKKAEIEPHLLPCRPCSVYGKEPCHRGDYACLNQLDAELVVKQFVQ